jgi:hypothetical protein
MAAPVSDTTEMIRGMAPRLDPETYVFVTTAEPEQIARLLPQARALYREAEGTSLILPRQVALDEGIADALAMRCITLEVHSALDGVGLTAAVATALSEQGIACNMVAAYHHDHAFVPAERAKEALDCLRRRAVEG